MKSVIVAILAFFYLGTSTGATLHIHYCMGKLIDIRLWHSEDNRCGNCGMNKKSSCSKQCCKDEHKLLKVEKEHQKAMVSFFYGQQPAIFTSFDYPGFIEPAIVSLSENFPISNAPPRSSTQLHILHCVFRI